MTRPGGTAMVPLREAPLAPARDGDRWSGVAVGLGIAALIGLVGVVVYLAVSRRREQAPPQLGAPQPAQPASIYFAPQIMLDDKSGQQTQATAAQTAAPPAELTEKTYMRTVDLPAVENPYSRAVRVVQAPKDTPYQAEIQVVSPPGSFAVLSFDAATLNLPMQNGALPRGDTMSVPAGVFKPVFLAPGQVLYGKGANGGNPAGSVPVTVSVSAAQPAARIIPMRR